jgi:hypothetical protein
MDAELLGRAKSIIAGTSPIWRPLAPSSNSLAERCAKLAIELGGQLPRDETRRIAVNIAKLPDLLRKARQASRPENKAELGTSIGLNDQIVCYDAVTALTEHFCQNVHAPKEGAFGAAIFLHDTPTGPSRG